ncbi:MAG: LamG-like jellyroll fold domain-containing protein [Candidatus Saccharibacteria bacterium]
MHLHLKASRGFTIVELLIVIVVIGILAAITIVAYSSVSRRATVANLQSDLTNASNLLKLFQVDNNVYPDTIICAQPDDTANKCLKPSGGVTYTYSVNNVTNPQTFCVNATRGGIGYSIGPNTKASLGVGCPVFSLDAGETASYSGSGTSWKNIGSGGGTGTLQGGVNYSSSGGGALGFDGTSGYVSTAFPTGPNFDTDFTVSIWIKSASFGIGTGIFQKTDPGSYSTSKGFSITNISSPQTVYVWLSNGASVKALNTGLNTYGWTNLTVTRSGNVVQSYLNAANIGTLDLTAFGSINGSNGLELGRGNNGYWNGSLASTAIYDRALTSAEVLLNFNSTKARYGL